jgi:hypothetical protein
MDTDKETLGFYPCASVAKSVFANSLARQQTPPQMRDH